MPERRKPQRDTLESIATELDGELRQLRLSKLKIGRLLLKARPLMPHGGWIAWVEARGLSDRTANNYMALAKSEKFSDLPDDADPTYREAGMLADLTPSDTVHVPPLPDAGATESTTPERHQPTSAAVRAVESLATAIDREGDSWRAVVQSWDVDRLAPFCGMLERIRAWADEVLAELKEPADADSSRHAA